MYIYEQSQWPQFIWDQEAIVNLLIEVRHKQGRLAGGMGSIGFQFHEESILDTITQDVVKSSEIEGEILDQSLVRSSVARHLGLEVSASPIDRNIDGVVEMMLDATQRFDQPLTKERLFHWHALLFPNGRSGFKKITIGYWRKGAVDVVSGHMGKEVVHFEAPPANRIEFEMDRFLEWINSVSDVDAVLKAAIAHLWFLTIHPFEDGNGRIGRAIADMLLARSENSSWRFYSLSTQIQKERKNYYAILEKTQKDDLNITPWIVWFLHCMQRAIEQSQLKLNMIIKKGQFWESVADRPFNERQRKVINRLLDGFEGKFTTSKWSRIAHCSQDTAYRDILELMGWGILIKNPEGGRSTNYSLNC